MQQLVAAICVEINEYTLGEYERWSVKVEFGELKLRPELIMLAQIGAEQLIVGRMQIAVIVFFY